MDIKPPIQIAISGDLGSGKSTVSQVLSEKYQLKSYSTGKIQREMAKQRGISTLEMNRLAEDNREIDFEIDNFSKALNKAQENFIIDSRLAWFFIKNSFKVFLKVDERIAAERIFNHRNRESEKYQNVEEVIKSIQQRKQSEIERYLKLYGVELNNPNNYHLVVDTSKRSIGEVVEIIEIGLKQFQDNRSID